MEISQTESSEPRESVHGIVELKSMLNLTGDELLLAYRNYFGNDEDAVRIMELPPETRDEAILFDVSQEISAIDSVENP